MIRVGKLLRCVVLVLDRLCAQTCQSGLVVARKLLEQSISLSLLVLKLFIVSVDTLEFFIELCTCPIRYREGAKMTFELLMTTLNILL